MKNFSKFAVLMVLIVSIFAITGCNDPDQRIKTGDTAIADANITDVSVKAINTSQPIKSYTYSQERKNLQRRMDLFNSPNTVCYIACVSNDGKVMKTGVVQGKVSSLNSLLTNPQQPVPVKSGKSDVSYEYLVLPSPDLDGSYGDNPHGVFWFSPEGVYNEWTGIYMLQDQPFVLLSPPVLNFVTGTDKSFSLKK